ncbi:MAG: peptidylprolyl isomerase [Candidatus Latescibacteria bacterium]|nr:peptidylprolyl isomerase [Candidatus Latescibacterota bacterium]
MKFARTHTRTPSFLVVILLAATAAAAAPSGDAPLVFVGRDTITVADLDMELYVTLQMNKGQQQQMPEPSAVLRRLIQNELIIQEGYRTGLHRKDMITSQVRETVRSRSIVVLLDSIAATAPLVIADQARAREGAIEAYIDGLKLKYGIKVDTALLASLDYASTDPTVQKRLNESDAVLAKLPSGALRVGALTRNLRFEHFHGLANKPDAAQIRDEFFEKWFSEALLGYESGRLGIPERRMIKRLAAQQERDLVLEEMVNSLGRFRYAPTEAEIAAFYRENIAHLTPPARLKVQSVLLEKQRDAETFKQRLDQGAEMTWLAKRTSEVRKDAAALPTTWLQPSMIGLKPGEARPGQVLDPYEVPGGWVVAVVTEIEQPVPRTLADCREDLLLRMKAQRTRENIADAFARLEAATTVRIVPGAETIVRDRLARESAKESHE